MKTSTPKKYSHRDALVETMKRKLASPGSAEQIITAHRRERARPVKYLYWGAALAAVAAVLIYQAFTGQASEDMVEQTVDPAAPPEKSALELMKDDLSQNKFGPDQYAIYLKDYLIRYDSLPQAYKSARHNLTSDEIYSALLEIWPQTSPGTRSELLKKMPPLKQKLEQR